MEKCEGREEEMQCGRKKGRDGAKKKKKGLGPRELGFISKSATNQQHVWGLYCISNKEHFIEK